MIEGCRAPGCTNTGGKGLFGNFCRGHAAVLARLRRELDTETPDPRQYRIYGTRYMLGDGQRDDT